MIVHYTARQTELTADTKAYCEKRLQTLEKLLGSEIEVDLTVSEEKYRVKAEIHVKAKGTSLKVAEETRDLMSALNLAFDGLEKNVKKEREKWREKKRRRGRERKSFPVIAAEPEPRQPRLVRCEDYSLKPMLLDEALIQFDLEKRDVFLFRKSGSEKWALIYRRKDGNYGLVEPE